VADNYPSYCCQRCGEIVGYLGRLLPKWSHNCWVTKAESLVMKSFRDGTNITYDMRISGYINKKYRLTVQEVPFNE
jgi:hypothetical protein